MRVQPKPRTAQRAGLLHHPLHENLADFPAALEVWHEALAGPLPIAAVEVAWLPVPGARVLVDLWVYAP